MQILQQVKIPSGGKGSLNLSTKDCLVYVGMTPHVHRLAKEKDEKEKKNEETEVGEK